MSSLCAPTPTALTKSEPPDRRNFSAAVAKVSSDHPEHPTFKWIEDMEAQSRIIRYLSTRGHAQRQARIDLVNWFRTSVSPRRHIETLLQQIRKGVSESRLEAAIDLLTLLGPLVVPFAVRAAFGMEQKDSVGAYVLAMAAGRIDSSLIYLFQNSINSGCREAVINLVDDLPAEEGVPILRQLASDTHPSIRRLAQLSLSD